MDAAGRGPIGRTIDAGAAMIVGGESDYDHSMIMSTDFPRPKPVSKTGSLTSHLTCSARPTSGFSGFERTGFLLGWLNRTTGWPCRR